MSAGRGHDQVLLGERAGQVGGGQVRVHVGVQEAGAIVVLWIKIF
ncbi:hypothetical protein ACQEUU_21150 [Nonomuraea sp. CA-218870]